MPGFIVKSILSINDGNKRSTLQGRGGKGKLTSEFVRSSVLGTARGQAQIREVVSRRDLVNSAVLTPIFVDNVSEQIFVDAFSTYHFHTTFIGRSTAGTDIGEAVSFEIIGIVTKNTADGVGPAVLTLGTKNTLVLTNPALAWDVSCDVVGENLRLLVQGDATNTIRWVANTKIFQSAT